MDNIYLMSFTEHAEPLHDRYQTADAIKDLVQRYSEDLDQILLDDGSGNLRPLSSLTLREFFDFVRLIPYKRDTEPVEVIGRPLWIADQVAAKAIPGIDCKKKAVLIGAYCQRKGYDYRFIGASNRPDREIHHIYPQIFLKGLWINADATYKRNRFGEEKFSTAEEIL